MIWLRLSVLWCFDGKFGTAGLGVLVADLVGVVVYAVLFNCLLLIVFERFDVLGHNLVLGWWCLYALFLRVTLGICFGLV